MVGRIFHKDTGKGLLQPESQLDLANMNKSRQIAYRREEFHRSTPEAQNLHTGRTTVYVSGFGPEDFLPGINIKKRHGQSQLEVKFTAYSANSRTIARPL
jgi:hypothetical protein